MESYPFIFSSETNYRVSRHVIFWLFWWLFFGFLYAASPFLTTLTYLERLPSNLIESLLYLTTHMFLCYSLIYFVLPVYLLKNKYLSAALWTLFLFLLTATMSSWISLNCIAVVRSLFLPQPLLLNNHDINGTFFMALLAGLRGGITISGIAVGIKLMKHWYIKEQRNLQLQKENTESQLQLLKAQIHPHFLFNTLNNIYSYTQDTSPQASRLLMGLSGMLRYILYEGNQALVPLVKELNMMNEYIALERIRYGNKLELHLDLPSPSHSRDLYIAPLLLLPFMENCFKHGTSNMLEQPWLNLEITIENKTLILKLLNGKLPYRPPSTPARGIGIINVRKRLQLLYPGRHELIITDEEEVYIVNLKLELVKKQLSSSTPVMKRLSNHNHA